MLQQTIKKAMRSFKKSTCVRFRRRRRERDYLVIKSLTFGECHVRPGNFGGNQTVEIIQYLIIFMVYQTGREMKKIKKIVSRSSLNYFTKKLPR